MTSSKRRGYDRERRKKACHARDAVPFSLSACSSVHCGSIRVETSHIFHVSGPSRGARARLRSCGAGAPLLDLRITERPR